MNLRRRRGIILILAGGLRGFAYAHAIALLWKRRTIQLSWRNEKGIALTMSRREVYIVSAVRTPIGKFGGALAEFTAPDLGVIAVRAALERAFGLPLPPERQPGEGAAVEETIRQATHAGKGASSNRAWHV